jgi:hypothetical protein
MSTKPPLSESRSDEVIVVPVNSIQFAEWGSSVDFYARIINLTMRELRVTGSTWNTWQRTKPETLEDLKTTMHSVPYSEIPRMFVSPPFKLYTLELNPDDFDVGRAQYITFSYHMGYQSTPETPVSCERATWHVGMPKKT